MLLPACDAWVSSFSWGCLSLVLCKFRLLQIVAIEGINKQIRDNLGFLCLVYSLIFAGGMGLAYLGQKTLAKS